MATGQLSGHKSVRGFVENIYAQTYRFYHLGNAKLSRSILSHFNENKPYALYEVLFGKLLKRCQGELSGHNFHFKNPFYSLDASTIDLYLSVLPWTKYPTTKGTVKLHFGLNHAGYLPDFVKVTDVKKHDITVGRFPKGSIFTIDKAYNDYSRYKYLTDKGIYFVTRLKANARYRVVSRREELKNKGLTSNQIIEFTGIKTAKKCPVQLRRIGHRDMKTGQHYVFLTNSFKLAARTIADIYKARWQVELFFKWIKQNQNIKSFFDTSKYAVMSQIWFALCIYLLLVFRRFQSKLKKSRQQALRLLQLYLFEKRDMMALLRGGPSPDRVMDTNQMVMM